MRPEYAPDTGTNDVPTAALQPTILDLFPDSGLELGFPGPQKNVSSCGATRSHRPKRTRDPFLGL